MQHPCKEGRLVTNLAIYKVPVWTESVMISVLICDAR